MRRLASVLVALLLTGGAKAQDIVGIITEGITKVIRAVDLQVQRIQTRTILLQDVQQELQNTMSALRLGEIHDWIEQQRELYANYFQELRQVKEVLSGYHKVTGIIERQEQIVTGCEKAMRQFGQDSNFSAAEIAHILSVYGGILSESAKNLDQLTRAIQPYLFQMTDQERMALIDGVAAGMDRNYRDMQVFTNENELAALQRTTDENDYLTLKKLYGL